MTDIDRKLSQHLRKESDEVLFSQMEMRDRVKMEIRRQAALEKVKRRFVIPRSWLIGTAALVAAILIIAGFPMLQQPTVPTPTENAGEELPSNNNGGAVGSELSELITTTLSTVEEAKAAFGPSLLVPYAVPNGFTLSEIVATGMKGKPARDAVFTYVSGEKLFTFAASRLTGSFPVDMFTPTQVGSFEGYVFEQPELIEVYWMVDGIQYSITGQLSADEAMNVAESIA